LGRTPTGVRNRRRKLGLPKIDPAFVWWKPDEDQLLGKAPDAEIAGRPGRTESSVQGRRLLLDIKFPNPRRPWPTGELARLGTQPDAVLAKEFNRPEYAVRAKRLQLGRGETAENKAGCKQALAGQRRPWAGAKSNRRGNGRHSEGGSWRQREYRDETFRYFSIKSAATVSGKFSVQVCGKYSRRSDQSQTCASFQNPITNRDCFP
jgi:hypothetical protein